MNTVTAHHVICGDIDAPTSPGFFRGGRDLCEKAEEDTRTIREVRALRAQVTASDAKVAQLEAEIAELAAVVRKLRP